MIANDQTSNPEFPSQLNSKPTQFNAQLFTLKNTVIQLRNAYNGHDVEWADVGMYSIAPYYRNRIIKFVSVLIDF